MFSELHVVKMDILKCYSSCLLTFTLFLSTGHGGKWVTFNNSEFYIETRGFPSITWEAARAYCESQNAIIASITSAQENNFLKDHVINNYEYWIGLRQSDSCTCRNAPQQTCTNCRLSWTWQDTTQMSYYNWEFNEPNDPSSACGRYRASTGWADKPCNSNIFFICKREINEFSSNPCRNGGRCEDRLNNYHCVCADGYSGANCEREINECSSSPCRHDGRCEDKVNSYQCVCPGGYSGTNCEIEINECSSSPCLHGGRCEDNVNSYQCVCPGGYSGTNCEIEVDECEQPGLCKNGATCNNTPGSYLCLCGSGWDGIHCENDTDECLSFPCQNRGTCVDSVNSYYCECPDQFKGINCEKEESSTPPDDETGLLRNVDRKDLVISLYFGAVLAAILITVLVVFIVLECKDRRRTNQTTQRATQ